MNHQHQADASGLPAAQAAGVPQPPALGQLAVRGGLYTLGGHAVSQVLRLAGNLILTRLLFPEAFGLMALVQIVLIGTQAFSDVGLRGSVIHHPRGNDPLFLDSAWTLQIFRGFAVWAVVSILAWPISLLYEQPQLASLIPVAGLAALIRGFQSTALWSLQRQVRPARMVATELAAQSCGLVAMLTWAYFQRSVWALVVGSLVSAAVHVAASHRLVPGYVNRFRLEKEASRSILRFGRWILISTAMTFVLNQGDRLVLGKLITASELGVYSISYFLSQSSFQAVHALSVKVLFPLYARIRERKLSDLRRAIGRSRRVVLGFALPPLWVLALFGPEIVELLYDPRYHEAGWMLQILAVGMLGAVVGATGERVLLANGDSLRHMLLQGSYALLLIAGMGIGGWMDGIRGLLIGVSAARILGYAPYAISVHRYGLWQPGIDATAFTVSACVLVAGFGIRWSV